MNDLKFAFRQLLKNPGFTAVAMLTLALGIGANTAIFSGMHAVLLRPMSVNDADRLMAIMPVSQKNPEAVHFSSIPDLRSYREHTKEVLSDVFAISSMPRALNLRVRERTVRVWAGFVSANYFPALGVKPLLGRTFVAEEDGSGGSTPVVMLSEPFWRRHFLADPGVIGQTLKLKNVSYTIVGVVAERDALFRRVMQTDLFVPTARIGHLSGNTDFFSNRGNSWLFCFGRLRPRVSWLQAQAGLDVLAAQLQDAYPDRWGQSAWSGPLGLRAAPVEEAWGLPAFLPRDKAPKFFAALVGTAALVLIIACTNIANLLLARAAARQREIAVRLALGAGRWRLMRQLLAECVLLALLGGTAGLLLALWVTDTVARWNPSIQLLPYMAPVTLAFTADWRIIGFALGLSMLTALLFGLAPAVQATKAELIQALKEGSLQAGQRLRGFSLRKALVAGQLAISLVLLSGAGLFVRALHKALSTDLGFDSANLAVVSVDFVYQGYTANQSQSYVEQALQRLRQLPGVRAAAFATTRPLEPGGMFVPNATMEGSTVEHGKAAMLRADCVGPGYFEVARIPILRGRGLEETDRRAGVKPAVVNEALVNRYWPGQDGRGKRIILPSESWEIVGVARTGKYGGFMEDPTPVFYFLPVTGNPPPAIHFYLRVAGSPEAMLDTLRRELERLDPDIPVVEAKSMQEHLAVVLLPTRVAVALSSAYGLLSMAIVLVGLTGTLTYFVTCRTREIGIRMALGAQDSDVVRYVLREGINLAGFGIVIGLASALGLTRLLRSLLFDVSPNDPGTFAVMSLFLALVSLLACWIPARRATRIDPIEALRYE